MFWEGMIMRTLKLAAAMLAMCAALAGCATEQDAAKPPPSSAGTPVPYGTRTERPGFVRSPWNPTGPLVDVTGFASGTVVKDPTTNQNFLVP